MSKILIYAGTTEGRKLSETLSEKGIACDVSVATEYGEQVMEPSKNVKVLRGRLSVDEMKALYLENHYDAVVDATHPFATVVTENILESIRDTRLPYFRLARDLSHTQDRLLRTVESVEECIPLLKATKGNILLTTGSKELSKFCVDEELKRKLFVRVLPGKESIDICYDCGLEGRQVIAMQGPFSMDMNLATINQYNIACMVTKESGKTGGLDEKVQAAAKAGIPCIMIQKPGSRMPVKEQTYGEVVTGLEELLHISIRSKGKLYVTLAGVGMGTEETKTLGLYKAIAEADIIFGAPRMLLGYEKVKKTYPYYLAKDILPCLCEMQKKEAGDIKAVILFSGDTGFYSGCEKLCKALKELDNTEVKVLPGISSLSYFAAKLKTSWQDAYIVSAHGIEEAVWKAKVQYGMSHYDKVFFLCSGKETIHQVKELVKNKDAQWEMYVGYNLTYPDEKVFKSNEEIEGLNDKGLYVGMLQRLSAGKASITPGFSDDDFLRDKVPMTKEEVREISICKLKLTREAIVYDIGSGTGSIAIEMGKLSPDMKVYAIETNPVAVNLIDNNKLKFGTTNVHVIEGMAPAALEKLPIASHAFIGGSKGNMKEILDALYNMNPHMRVVINAISLESIAETTNLLKQYPIEQEDITMVNISKAKAVGNYQLMQANNPVYVFAFNFAGI